MAQKNHVPAYIVFNNVNLDEMAELKPRTMGDFRRISGVGDAKAAKYGEAFIKHIAKWVREHSGGRISRNATAGCSPGSSA